MGEETTKYLLSKLRKSRRAISESSPEASCRAHGPMADGLACLLECKELEIEAAEESAAQDQADAAFRSRVQWVISAVLGALGSAGLLKLFS